MKCWICSKKGNTGEHLIKASDLKSYFGAVSQSAPLYFHTSKRKNIPVGSIKKSKRLKSDALICNECNSSLTQPYDKAWEQFSVYLRSNWDQVYSSGKVNLTKVFPGSVKESLLNVHLFFVKLFGCRIIENAVPIDITQFQNSLLKARSHKNVFLSIGPRPGKVDHKYAGLTPIKSVNINGGSAFATWLYMIDQLAVNIIYVTKYRHPDVMENTFHPDKLKIILNISEFRT